jgi:hypothetical protein
MFHPDTLEVLTFFLSSAEPAYVLVFYTDLFKDWGKELAQVSFRGLRDQTSNWRGR